MTKSEKHRCWKFLIVGMICSIITGGSFVISGFSKPTQEGSCIPCHTAAGDPDAAPLTISVNTTYVEVQPSSTFYLEVSASGGEPDHMMVKFPNDVADNSLFTYSPREIYDGDDASVDGNVSPTAVNVTSPATQGLYTIRVFAATSAYDSYDKTATYTDISVNVTAQPPVASFTYSPLTPLVNQTVTFDASASYDVDGYIVNYTWSFGDFNVTTTSDPIITHVYMAAGVYNVTLTVTDNDGLTDITSTAVTVEEAPLPPLMIYTDKYTYSAGETMHLGLDIANPYDFPLTVCIAIWLERPVGPIILILHAHAVTLPAGFTYSDPDFKSFVLPSIPPGIYTWHAAFLNSTTHSIIVEDTAEWEFV